jgi:hypothetical protein
MVQLFSSERGSFSFSNGSNFILCQNAGFLDQSYILYQSLLLIPAVPLCGPLRQQLGVIAGQLQADAYVVLHAAHFARQRDPILLEGGDAELELVGVNLHLLPQPQQEASLVFADQGLVHVDPPLLQHDHHQLAHGVLDGLCGQHPNAVRLAVYVEANPWEHVQGPLVVLRLETQVPLDVDYYGRRCLAWDLPQHVDVVGHQGKLLGRLCKNKK